MGIMIVAIVFLMVVKPPDLTGHPQGSENDAALPIEVQLHARDVRRSWYARQRTVGRPLRSTSNRSAGSSMGSGTPSARTTATTCGRPPTNVSMAAVALAISGGGALSSLETTVLLTVEETIDRPGKGGADPVPSAAAPSSAPAPRSQGSDGGSQRRRDRRGLGRLQRRTMTANDHRGDAPPMPHVATSPADLLSTIRAAAHLDGDVLVIDDETGLPHDRHPRPRLDRGVLDGRRHDRGRAVDRLGGQPGARRAERQHPGAVRGPRPRRGVGLHGPGRSTCARRRSTWPGPRSRRPMSADVGAVIFEIARSEQTYTFQRPIDFATSVLAGAIAAGWRAPVFIQGDHYQFNAKKYAADPEAMTEEIRRACRLADRRRLPQHRHRLLDARRPLEADGRRAAARELPPRGRADRAHPDARGGRRDDQRRWRDRRGRHPELDGRGAARLPRRLSPRARGARARRRRPVEGQRPDRHEPRRRAAAGWRRGRGQARLRGAARARRGRPARVRRWPAPSSTAPRPCPTSCSIASRRSRPPRSTSRPGSRTRCTSTRRSRRTSTAGSRRGASRTRPTSASPARPTSSSSTRPARRRSGRSSASCGTSTTKDEILAAQRRKFSFLFTELGVNGSREMIAAYIRPVEVHRPMPDALREAVAAG